MKFCTECGKENINRDDVCSQCGTLINKDCNQNNSDSLSSNAQILKQLEEMESQISSIERSTRRDKGVVVNDIEVGFISLVYFMVKLMIASIPAAIIVSIIFPIILGLTTVFFGGF